MLRWINATLTLLTFADGQCGWERHELADLLRSLHVAPKHEPLELKNQDLRQRGQRQLLGPRLLRGINHTTVAALGTLPSRSVATPFISSLRISSANASCTVFMSSCCGVLGLLSHQTRHCTCMSRGRVKKGWVVMEGFCLGSTSADRKRPSNARDTAVLPDSISCNE